MTRKIRGVLGGLLLAALLGGCGQDDRTIAKLDDAASARIGVMTGSTGEAITKARFPGAQVKSFDDVMDAVAAIKSHQLDAIVTAYPLALQVVKGNPELRRIDEPLANEDSAIAVRKNRRELYAAVDGAIAELLADGTLAAMKQRWFKTDSAPYDEPEVALPSDGVPLRIGVAATREPFSFVDQNGRVSGHDGELARRVAARLGRPVEFFDMKFMALIPALQSGKVDLIVSGMTATDERRKSVDFTRPYFANAQVMLVRAGSVPAAGTAASAAPTTRIATLQQLADKRLCVLTGSAGDLAARKHFPKASFVEMTTTSDAALAVATGKADALIYDRGVMQNLIDRNPGLAILEPPVDKLEVAIALSRDNGVLLAQIEAQLAALKKEGVLSQLKAKWVVAKYSTPPALPPLDDKAVQGVLRLGTAAVIEPFSFIANGAPTGLDIELARRIGERLGKRIEIVDLPFDSLIPALQSGKIDLAMANFNVTDERRKLIAFSTPYLENDISALVRHVPAANAAPSYSVSGRFASVDDIADKRIGLLLGSVHDRYAAEHYPKATILQYKSPSDLLLAVKSGKVDAGLYTHETLLEVLRADPELALLGEPLFTVPIGVGFNLKNDALRRQFNDFLAGIKADGVYADMVERWIRRGETTMPQIANRRDKGVLVVGNVSDKGLPFTVVKDGRLIGFDVELTERFGAYLGREVKVADMEFGSLIAAVATSKIDAIVSTLMITDERREKVAFSDPYYELGGSVVVLRQNVAAATGDALPPPEPGFLTRLADSFERNIVAENRYLLLWDGLKTTVVISVAASLFGTLLGALVCFMRMSRRALLRLPAQTYIALLRGMPVLVLLMLIFYVVFASVDVSPVLVAVIAFGMNFAAYSAEIFRSGIESIDQGQREAGVSLGFTPLKTFYHIVLPQTVRRILPVYRGEFISLVKMTSIVGYIAVQDLTKASDIIRSRTFDAFFPLIMIAVLYFLISWLLMQALAYLEWRIDPRARAGRSGNKGKEAAA